MMHAGGFGMLIRDGQGGLVRYDKKTKGTGEAAEELANAKNFSLLRCSSVKYLEASTAMVVRQWCRDGEFVCECV